MSYKFKPAIYLLASMLLLTACGEKTKVSSLTEAEKLVIAQKYENKIVHQTPANRPGIEDGAYLVKNGKRFWIANGAWIAKNGYAADAEIEISSSDFYAIPLDPKILE